VGKSKNPNWRSGTFSEEILSGPKEFGRLSPEKSEIIFKGEEAKKILGEGGKPHTKHLG